MTTPPDNVPAPLRVSEQSQPLSVAHAIADTIQTHGYVDVQATGAQAVFCAVQGVSIARTLLGAEGIPIHIAPTFMEQATNGDDLAAISLLVERQA